MEIFTLIENLEELIAGSSKVPFSSKVMVDKEELNGILEEIKLKLPDELKQAKRIKDERLTILNDAKEEANKILKDAQLKIVELVDENAITRQAIEQKEEIIENANRISKEISSGTKEYADNLLERIEELLSQTLDVVRENRKELK